MAESPDLTSSPETTNVILLTSSYPRHATDNASVFLRNLARQLSRKDFAVHVLAPADKMGGTVQEEDVTVTRFFYFPKRWQRLAYGSGIPSNLRAQPKLWLQVPFFAIAMTWALVRLVRHAQRPVLIHAHWIIPQGVLATIVGFALRVPVIVSLHGADAFAYNRGLLPALKRQCLRRCAGWTANTRATAIAVPHAATLPTPVIIPMGVDTARFASGSRNRLRADFRPDELIVLFVGRLVEKKGVDDLVKAYALLPDNLRTATTVWIIGRGNMEESLKLLSGRLGVQNRIRFWGEIPNDKLPDFYAAADLFVGPSVEAVGGDTEGQGVVFLEAFAAGLCVVATNVGGIPEIVEHEVTGFLVPPAQPDHLSTAISRLLSDTDLRHHIACNARQRANQYSWPSIADKFGALYHNVRRAHINTAI